MLSGHFAVNFTKFLPLTGQVDRYFRSWTDHQQLLRLVGVAYDHPGVRLSDANSNESTSAALPKIDECFAFAPSNLLHRCRLLGPLQETWAKGSHVRATRGSKA